MIGGITRPVTAQVREWAEALRVATSLQGQAKIADQHAATLRAQLDKLKGLRIGISLSRIEFRSGRN